MEAPRLHDAEPHRAHAREAVEEPVGIIHDLRVPLDIDSDALAVLVIGHVQRLFHRQIGIEVDGAEIELVQVRPMEPLLYPHFASRVGESDVLDRPDNVEVNLDRVSHVLLGRHVAELLAHDFPGVEIVGRALGRGCVSRCAEEPVLRLVRGFFDFEVLQ